MQKPRSIRRHKVAFGPTRSNRGNRRHRQKEHRANRQDTTTALAHMNIVLGPIVKDAENWGKRQNMLAASASRSNRFGQCGESLGPPMITAGHHEVILVNKIKIWPTRMLGEDYIALRHLVRSLPQSMGYNARLGHAGHKTVPNPFQALTTHDPYPNASWQSSHAMCEKYASVLVVILR